MRIDARQSIPGLGIIALLVAWAALAENEEPRPTRLVPALQKSPRLDGSLRDLAGGLTIAPSDAEPAASTFTAKVAYRGDTLFLGVEVRDQRILPGNILTVALHFPGAGTTARGYSYSFAIDGKRATDPENGPPAFADRWVRAAVQKSDRGMKIKAAFPARALPRFPASHPMFLELCITYEGRDQVAGPPRRASNCRAETMVGEVLQLPDTFRTALNIHPPPDIVGVERREHGWVGFALLHYPGWMASEREITPEVFRTFFPGEARDPAQARISLAPRMSLPDGRTVLSLLTGDDPLSGEGACLPGKELRLGLYVIQGRTARRVLEWPAATCVLGRAGSVVLEDDGTLTIGYSNGAIATFAWSGDHFERTEIG